MTRMIAREILYVYVRKTVNYTGIFFTTKVSADKRKVEIVITLKP